MDAERKRLLSAYLDGTLPEDERRRLEAEYAVDDELFEELVELENDRIDSQARDAPAGPERLRLVKRPAATAGQREREGFARALAERYRVRRKDEPLSPPLASAAAGPSPGARLQAPPYRAQPGLAVAMLAIAAGFIALFATNERLRKEVQALRHEQEEHRLSGQVAGQAQPRGSGERPTEGPRAPVTIASQKLRAGGTRSFDDPQTLHVGRGATLLQLELELEEDEYPRYLAALETVEGTHVFGQGQLKSRRNPVGESLLVLRLPADAVPTGDYVVRLSGLTRSGLAEPVDAYSLRIVQDLPGRK